MEDDEESFSVGEDYMWARQNDNLLEARRIAFETEQVGSDGLKGLHANRQKIQGIRTNNFTLDKAITQGNRMLQKIKHRDSLNKFIF